MTSPLPSLSVQQLTEQWHCICGNGDAVGSLHTAACSASVVPALLATIRRQQADLTAQQAVIDAVTELAARFERYDRDEDDAYASTYERGSCGAWSQAADELRAALASPDTAQES